MRTIIFRKVWVSALAVMLWAGLIMSSMNRSSAATSTTNTTLGITPGTFSFIKDVGATMDSYFSHGPNAWTSIDIGTYAASVTTTSASSEGNHRFTVSDLLGNAFSVTLQSSALTIAWASIPASAIGYTGTAWLGTGQVLTAAPTSAVDIGTNPVTFVARNNADGLSLFSQEITIKVAIPAAQKPGSYTGLLTFTY